MSFVRNTVCRDAYDEPVRTHAAVGETVSWMPTSFVDGTYPGAAKKLHGRIIYVNRPHRYYVAEAECHGYMLREAFKF